MSDSIERLFAMAELENSAPQPANTWEDIADPHEKLEVFLETEAPLFEQSTEAWRHVRDAQVSFKEMRTQEKVAGTQPPREIRRMLQQQFKAIGKGFTDFSRQKIDGQTISDTAIEANPGESCNILLAKIDQEAANNRQYFANAIEEDGATNAPIARIINGTIDLTHAYGRAFTVQHIATEKIRTLLSDDTVVPSFVSYIREAAAVNDIQQSKNPHLLELVATELGTMGDNSCLRDAVLRTAPTPDYHAKEFLDASTEHRRKELSAAFGMISVAAEVVEDFGINRDTFMSAMAQRSDTWAPELKQELQAYALGHSIAAWNEMRALLAPFIREGRLRTNTYEASVHSFERQKTTGTPGAPQTESAISIKAGRSFGSAAVLLARGRQNNEDISAETLPKTLEKFAIMRGLGKKRELYAYDEVDTLEELYELSNLSEYAEKHKGDPTLENVLKTGLKHLIEQPFDQACTKHLVGVSYEIDLGNGLKQRSPRRNTSQASQKDRLLQLRV